MSVTSNSIITPQAIQAAAVVTTTAETAYNAPVTAVVKLMTFGPNGGRLTRLRSIPRATVTATGLHLYLSTDGGVTKMLIDSKLMAAHTVAATTGIPVTDWGYSDTNPLFGPPNAELYISQAVGLANGIAHDVEWADY
jgi:hypothetical protein